MRDEGADGSKGQLSAFILHAFKESLFRIDRLRNPSSLMASMARYDMAPDHCFNASEKHVVFNDIIWDGLAPRRLNQSRISWSVRPLTCKSGPVRRNAERRPCLFGLLTATKQIIGQPRLDIEIVAINNDTPAASVASSRVQTAPMAPSANMQTARSAGSCPAGKGNQRKGIVSG